MTETMIRRDYSLNLKYSAPLGRTYSGVLLGLKDRKLLANKCSACGRLYVPGRPFCDICCEDTGELFEVEPVGEVIAFTVYNLKTANLPEPPFAQGIIKVGDAATSFLHFLGGVDFADAEDFRRKLRIGMKVKAVWAEERTGSILDIAHFAPAG